MYVNGLGVASSPYRYSQSDCWEVLQHSALAGGLSRRSHQLLQRILLGDNGIDTRHFVVSTLAEVVSRDPDCLHQRFSEHAPLLATAAAERALADADIGPGDIDAVVVSTCTGYLCPGLSSYVHEGLGLRPDVLAYDLVGQGCAAALPNWQTADALLNARRARRVLSICVEICSAAFYLDDDPGVLISACLFGDGAGAAVLGLEPGGSRPCIRWRTSGSLLNPKVRDELRFEHRHGLLRNILSRAVPELAAVHAEQVLDRILDEQRLSRQDIATWIWHAGGRNVLQALQQRIGLADHDMALSASVLRQYGNLSSAFVYFVLSAALAESKPKGYWWMASFGAGFSSHGALLEVT